MKTWMIFASVPFLLMSGCHKPRSRQIERPPNPVIEPASTESSKVKTPDPSLVKLQNQVDAAYDGITSLSFTAKLRRQDQESGDTAYTAEVEMSPGIVELRVFDTKFSDQTPIYEWWKEVTASTMKERMATYSTAPYEFIVNGCLFGTIKEPWPGSLPKPATDRPYSNRIRDGTDLGLEELGNQTCRHVRYEIRGEDYMVVQDYFIHAETYLLIKWNSSHYSSLKRNDPEVVVTREYCYHNQEWSTLLSANTGDLK